MKKWLDNWVALLWSHKEMKCLVLQSKYYIVQVRIENNNYYSLESRWLATEYWLTWVSVTKWQIFIITFTKIEKKNIYK